MKVAVILNAAAGSCRSMGSSECAGLVERELFQQGLNGIVMDLAGASIPELLRRAKAFGADVVVAGGGDGTVSAVAAELSGWDMPLAVLPLGTRNHFARDLQVPIALTEAVQTLRRGGPVAIDVGEVNDRIFINNSSLGVYPLVIGERHKEMQRHGSRLRALVLSTIRIIRRLPLMRLHFEMEGRKFTRVTPFVFVGNNRYAVKLFSAPFRSCLRGGQLCVYMSRCVHWSCLVRLLWAALWDRLDQERNFESFLTSSIRIEGHKRMKVAADGEVLRLQSPLDYRTRPAFLRVWIPRESELAIQ